MSTEFRVVRLEDGVPVEVYDLPPVSSKLAQDYPLALAIQQRDCLVLRRQLQVKKMVLAAERKRVSMLEDVIERLRQKVEDTCEDHYTLYYQRQL